MGMNLAVIAGGRSAESDDTHSSSVAILETARECGYDARLVELTHEGDRRGLLSQLKPDDVVYPTISGLEGVLEFCGLAYVGASPTLAGLAADKVLFNSLVRDLGLGKVPYVWGTASAVASRVRESTLTPPLYVKPARLGASLGITRIDGLDDLAGAVTEAARHDDKVLVEQTVPGDFYEVELAGIAGDDLRLSVPGRIELSHGSVWHDWAAKDTLDTVLIPVDDAAVVDAFSSACEAIVEGLDYCGPFRMDGFVTDGADLYIGEMNCIPGQSVVSTFPRLFEASGMSRTDQLERMVAAALYLRDRVNRDRAKY